MELKFTTINSQLGIIGTNIEFINEDFYGLKVGESIIQIGDGRENGTIRTDVFKYHITYSGAIVCKFKEEEKMYAFKMPVLFNEQSVFLLYGDTGCEIFTEVATNKKRTNSYMRFYKPVFKK